MPVAECKISVRQDRGRQGRRADAVKKSGGDDLCQQVSAKELCVITRQLATLLRAGMPLVPALGGLAEQLRAGSGERAGFAKTSTGRLAGIIADVRDRVNQGQSLAESLGGYRKVFSELYINMVAAGEVSGSLEDVLLRLAAMLEKRAELSAKVKSALAYPIMMTVVAVGVVVFLLSFVVPSLTAVFVEMDTALPWPTRMLISVSGFLKSNLVFILIIFFAGLVGVKFWLQRPEGKLRWDRNKLKVPLFGGLFLKLATARMARTLGTLLGSGSGILQALDITKSVVGNSYISRSLGFVRERISKGDSVAEAIRQVGVFPPIVFHILATGQLSANLEQGLGDIADMYDGEVDRQAKMLTSLLEPCVLLFMGAVIGFIVLAILLPIFEINQVL